MKQLYTYVFSLLFYLIALPAFSQAEFVQNKGQWNNNVLYKARIPSGNLFIEKDKITFSLIHPEDFGINHNHNADTDQSHIRNGQKHTKHNVDDDPVKVVKAHAYQVAFMDYNKNVKVITSAPYAHKYNFFHGKDISKWASDAKAFNEIIYKNIYPGVDINYFVKINKLKYDIIIEAGTDPSVVKMQYNNVDGLELQNGKLIIRTSVNTVTEHIPEAYQIINGKKKIIQCEFVLEENIVSFIFPKGYNNKFPITIDPVIDFASYTGSTTDNWGFTATFNDNGNLFAGGIAFNVGYPVTAGAYDMAYNQLIDVAISKFSSDGKSLIYSTYLGGSNTEAPSSMIVNSKGELVIYGVTGSMDFPVTADAFQKDFKGGDPTFSITTSQDFVNGSDIFVTVLSEQGNNLIGSTYYGGNKNEGLNQYFKFNYGDEFRGEVIVDDQDNIYVATNTLSNNIPLTTNAFRTVQENFEACIFKLSPTCNNLIFSSYFGGDGQDVGFSLKLDKNKNLFIAGATNSTNLPGTAGAYQTAMGFQDGFITKIDSNWQIIRTTHIGTGFEDVVYLMDLDQQGNVYSTGISYGLMPASPNVFKNDSSGQFIIKLNNDLTTREWSTVFGKGDQTPELSATAFMVDLCGNIYYSGWGGGSNKNVISDYFIHGLTVTHDALKDTTDGSDFYYLILSADAKSLVYATYFGGNISEEHVDGGTSRFDKRGIIYQGVCAGCGGNDDFPTTLEAYSAVNNGVANNGLPNCNMGVAKISFEVLEPVASAIAEPGIKGCGAFIVQFGNHSKGHLYQWDFDNGQTSTDKHPVVQFQPGIYNVSLIVTDTSNCTQSTNDTLILTIEVYDDPIAAFSSASSNSPGLSYKFNNESQIVNNSTYFWNFGDGSNSSEKDPEHTYADEGTYTVCLTVTDTISNCSDVTCKTIEVSEFNIVDIPNAFTPNGDGKNDILYVKGEGVGSMRLRIYNRWGQLLFESTDMLYGWDGTFKGMPQDMDTYIYYLDATLDNGEEVAKKGNITLIR